MTADAMSQRRRAVALLEMRRPAEARAVLEPLLRSDPNDAKAIVLLASCCQQEGDTRRALDLCRSAASSAPNDVVILLDCASVARVSGHHDDARAWALRALQQSPENVRALSLLTLTEVALKQKIPALQHAEQALALSSDEVELHVAYGLALSLNGRPAEAMEQYVRVLETQPAHVYALNNLAAERLRLGDVRRSTRLFARAVSVDPRLRIGANNIQIAAVRTRRLLLCRLALALGLVGVARELGTAVTAVASTVAVTWLVWSVLRVPPQVRRRLGSGFTSGDLISTGAVLAGAVLVLVSDPGTGDALPFAFILIVYGLVVAIGTAGRRMQVDAELRRRGVVLP
jgi:tetratricopeptide (TPR) repeat protein